MKKTGIAVITLMLLCGCAASGTAASSASSSETRLGCEWGKDSCSETSSKDAEDSGNIGLPSDMSSYESYNPDTSYVFVNSDVDHMLKRMQNGDTFVTYFGFSSCPWCRDAMPIINEVASQYEYQVDYIDTRSDPSWTSNLDLKDYDKLVDAIGDLFPTDDDGKAHLDVPFVVFFRNGKVVSSAGYPQYDAHERKISSEEAQQERDSYIKGFEALK